ncbi:ANTH domain-containing protein [Jimgerdemannia flammicorona]|uniref:ANTH domain-containing protein n=1 Tax=Jimgerdemannia flammicorona TaxID=994334 RepID=A0A433QYC4_9FUNG|nr:ANTH domain-containing protein [Jimgerdemannia flammicorona]
MSSYLPSRSVDREKAESELSLNIKKATNPDETAPKQKHVRSAIVYTWEYHASQSVWNGLKVQPILADEVQTFKALITVHKIIRGGHPVTIKDALRETTWLEACARSVMGEGQRGYGILIRAYVEFLMKKLNYHRLHPEFTGNFDYEEYISLKNIDDPNEGYETISDLMNLQDQIDQFQKLIFNHFRSSSNNECRIAALVPLVEESHAIYKFITSMLRAMHRRTDSSDALTPLRTRYNAQHYALLKFYYECSNLRYLTSLISVPKLPQDPPSLIDTSTGTPTLPKRAPPAPAPAPVIKPRTPTPPPVQPSPEPVIDFWSESQAQQQREYEEQQRQLQQQREFELQQQQMLQLQQQREFEEQQRLQMERERQQHEELLRRQMQQQAEGKVQELEREVLGLRGQFERDQMLLEQYDRRVKALQNEMNQLNFNSQQRDASKDELIKSLQDQITMWKNKYEALAKLYSQLRQEHLDLLNKFKQLQLKANSAQEAVEKLDRMQADMRAKNMELADMIRERDRAKNELERFRGLQRIYPSATLQSHEQTHLDELNRLKRELSDSNARVEDLGKSKGAETAALLAKFNREKSDLEDSIREDDADDAWFDDAHTGALAIVEPAKASRRTSCSVGSEEGRGRPHSDDEEIEIMQAGMDECLKQLADLQQNMGDKENGLAERLDRLTLDHSSQLNQILDSILTTCIQKINDGIYNVLDAPGQGGNQNATPEYTLSMIEKASTASTEFLSAFARFMDGSGLGDHSISITRALSLAQAIEDVITNAKGITRLAAEDETVEELIRVTRQSAQSAITYFSNVMSTHLDILPRAQRPEVVIQGNMRVQDSLLKVSRVAESLVITEAAHVVTLPDAELGDIVEKEMLNAARVIEDASARILALINKPRNPELSATDMQVHTAILEYVMGITNAIANLIKAATASQQEIVSQGRGSSTKEAFYKKNNRWTEGLISAAKAVAIATNLLVEAADGVISGTSTLEHLIVASNEVSAATAQLVAASRVKASFMSKTQEKLELAAKAVTDAANLLVKAVKALAAKQLEEKNKSKIDYNALSAREYKVKEMEQQVMILKLDKELTDARRVLAEMRKASYHQESQ